MWSVSPSHCISAIPKNSHCVAEDRRFFFSVLPTALENLPDFLINLVITPRLEFVRPVSNEKWSVGICEYLLRCPACPTTQSLCLAHFFFLRLGCLARFCFARFFCLRLGCLARFSFLARCGDSDLRTVVVRWRAVRW